MKENNARRERRAEGMERKKKEGQVRVGRGEGARFRAASVHLHWPWPSLVGTNWSLPVRFRALDLRQFFTGKLNQCLSLLQSALPSSAQYSARPTPASECRSPGPRRESIQVEMPPCTLACEALRICFQSGTFSLSIKIPPSLRFNY